MERRQLLGGGALALGALTVGYAAFVPLSDEELISATLDDLAAAISFSKPVSNPVIWGSQLSGKFKDLLTPQVQIQVAEVSASIPSAREQVGLAAAAVLQRYGSLDVSFSSLQILVTGDEAIVQATANVEGQLYGEHRRDSREVQLGMNKGDGDWRLAAAFVKRAQAVA